MQDRRDRASAKFQSPDSAGGYPSSRRGRSTSYRPTRKARSRSISAYPFAPRCQSRGHDHRAEEKADQSERLQPPENSDQRQQKRQPRGGSDERRLNKVVADEHDGRAEAEKPGGYQQTAPVEEQHH